MHVKQINARIKKSFTCFAGDEDSNLIEGEVKLVINRLKGRKIDQSEFKDKMKSAQDSESLEAAVSMIVETETVEEWDVFEDEELTTMLPITVDNIMDQPFDFIIGFANTVTEVLFPNSTRAANSPDGSAQVEKLASAARTSSAGGDSTSAASATV